VEVAMKLFRIWITGTVLLLAFFGSPAIATVLPPVFELQWGSLGLGNGQFGRPSALALNASGELFVGDIFTHRIQVFDSSGNYLRGWGSQGGGSGQFGGSIYGLAVAPPGTVYNGNVYVADTQRAQVEQFTSSGSFVRHWGSPGSGNGQFDIPSGIAVDASGNVYVADTKRVQKFDGDGNWISELSSSGSGEGQFVGPFSIAIDASGFIYVGDWDFSHTRILKFSSDGTFLLSWGSGGTGDGQLGTPTGIAFDSNGYVYVTDAGDDHNRVQIFSNSGTFLAEWGGTGTDPGKFGRPQGVAILPGGEVFVSDAYNNRIQKFSPAVTPALPTSWGKIKANYRN